MTISIVIALLIFPVLLSNPCIAFIALGVAAFPRPKMLLLMFMAICSFVVSSIPPPNKKSITGESSFANFLLSPVSSKIFKSPSQTA